MFTTDCSCYRSNLPIPGSLGSFKQNDGMARVGYGMEATDMCARIFPAHSFGIAESGLLWICVHCPHLHLYTCVRLYISVCEIQVACMTYAWSSPIPHTGLGESAWDMGSSVASLPDCQVACVTNASKVRLFTTTTHQNSPPCPPMPFFPPHHPVCEHVCSHTHLCKHRAVGTTLARCALCVWMGL